MSDYRKFTDLVIRLKKLEIKIQFAPQYRDEQLYHLTVMYCSDTIDLEYLSDFLNLEEIVFQNCNFQILDLRPLETLRKLRTLKILNCPNLRELKVCNFEEMYGFKHFIINKANLSQFSFEQLRDALALRAVTLKQIGNTSQVENHETRYSWWSNRRYYQDCEEEGLDRYDLKLLNYESEITEIDLSFISAHPNLEYLNVSYNQGTKRYRLPNEPPLKLRTIDLSFNSFGELDIVRFVSENLEVINITRGGLTSIDLTGVEKTGRLVELNLRENYLESIDLSPLRHAYSLEILNLSRNRLKSIDLTPLSKLKNLHQLILESNDLEFVDLQPLSGLDLRQLYLGDNKIEQIDLTPLWYTPHLLVLRLTRNRLRQIDLSPLEKCRLLQKLQLARNQLTDLTLDPLQGMTHLNEINLDRNPFQNLNLDALRSIPQIDFIDLTDVSGNASVNITPLLEKHPSAWVNLGPEENFNIDVEKIKDINLDGSSLVDHPAIIRAIDFEKSAKELIDAKTTLFAIRAIEHHDDIIDLLTRRLVEDRGEVSRAIIEKVRELREKEEEKD